jgi:hypothetical protein
MAHSVKPPGLIIVPQGPRPIPDSFTSFLWDNELGAFLAKPSFAGEAESGQTGLGISVAPGSC